MSKIGIDTSPGQHSAGDLAISPPGATTRGLQDRQGPMFRRLRFRLLNNIIDQHLNQSRLRLILILVFSVLFWFLLFGLFFEGFYFVHKHLPVSNQLIDHLFSLFFISLLVMLSFSTGLILYSGLYKSRESTLLLTMPASPDQIFAFKLQDSLAFSSWGFLLLGSPMMTAYGIIRDAPIWFYPVFVVYFLGFVLIPGGLGAIICMLMVRLFPRRKKRMFIAIGVGIIVSTIIWIFNTSRGVRGDLLSDTWLNSLMSQLRFSRNPLLPSQWMSEGLIAAATGKAGPTIFYLLVLLANALFCYLLATQMSRMIYRSGYSLSAGMNSTRSVSSWYWMDRLLSRCFFFVDPSVRLLILKDIRTFRRDPVQWSQFLIFFGLLALYLVNIRNLGYDLRSAYWRNLVSFLNLAVTALILSTFTSRFIFPMVSLEGKRFWILGLLPLHREHVLWGKFGFATGAAIIASESLVLISDLILRLSWAMMLLHGMTILILCMGLAGISVGLGARLPNLQEDDPSKIATGFGGTLNLVVSMIFILVIVVLLALPCHLHLAGVEAEMDGKMFLNEFQFRLWLGISIACAIAIGYAATVIPMKIGVKAFRELEA